jgi:hypothetical protein
MLADTQGKFFDVLRGIDIPKQTIAQRTDFLAVVLLSGHRHFIDAHQRRSASPEW